MHRKANNYFPVPDEQMTRVSFDTIFHLQSHEVQASQLHSRVSQAKNTRANTILKRLGRSAPGQSEEEQRHHRGRPNLKCSTLEHVG